MSGDDLLIERAHDVFDAEYRRLLPQGCSEAADHDEAVRSALAAVIAFVQASGQVQADERENKTT